MVRDIVRSADHPRLASLAALILTVSIALVAPLHLARAASSHGVPLPRGARVHQPGVHRSSLGFRKTVRFYRRHFDRAGPTYQLVPVYAYRGVAIARFLSRDPGTRWLAVHVVRDQGRTYIHVVPRGSKPP